MFLSFLHNVEGFEYLFEKKQKQQRASSCFVSISWPYNMDVGDATRISTDRLTPQYRTDWQLATVKHQQNVEKEKTEEDEKTRWPQWYVQRGKERHVCLQGNSTGYL